MKSELAVLPMDVWADVFVYPWITRQQLAQIVDQFKERAFAEKLQTFLHNPKCGKHSLRFLEIFYKPKRTFRPETESQRRPSLTVAPRGAYDLYLSSINIKPTCTNYEFPETEMPENINNFKQLTISFFNDQVLDFLNNIKPLFTNVLLDIKSIESANNLRTLLAHLLPIIGSIRGICCFNGCLEFLERHFPGTLARAKELSLLPCATKACIPAYLDWLTAPQDFDVYGPRFFKANAFSNTMTVLVDAIRKQFLAATSPSTFVIFLESYQSEQHNRAEKFTIQNAATNEKLTVRNAWFKCAKVDIHYVEIMRRPIGATAQMRDWIEERAYHEKIYRNNYSYEEAEPEQMVSIDGYSLTVGQITKKTGAVDQDNDQPEDDDEEDEAGPSTSAKKMKKRITKRKKKAAAIDQAGEDQPAGEDEATDGEEDEAGPSPPAAKKMKK